MYRLIFYSTLAAGILSYNSAFAGPVAEWRFDQSTPGKVSDVRDSVSGIRFEGEAEGVEIVPGHGLHIRYPAPISAAFYAPLPQVQEGPLWLVAELGGWHFSGKPRECVTFGLADRKEGPEIALSYADNNLPMLAAVRLIRTGREEPAVDGIAGGTGATLVRPGVKVPVHSASPATLALRYDSHAHCFAVFYREGNRPWRFVGAGATDEANKPNLMRLELRNPMNDDAEESVDVRGISISTETPQGLPETLLPKMPFITAEAWAVADAQTGEVLAEHGVDKPSQIASLTKLMTAYIITDLAAKNPAVLKEPVTFTETAEKTLGSTTGLPAGDTVTVLDALYGMMLPSGNDAAVLLCEYFSPRFAPPETPTAAPPARANFIAEMNRRAKALGMLETTYRHPATDAGKPSSTPRALLILVKEVMKNPIFAKIVSTPRYKAIATKPDHSTREIVWENTNHLLGELGVNGVKTGTDPGAKACLITSSVINGHGYYTVLLGANSYNRRFTDTRNLLQWVSSKGQGR